MTDAGASGGVSGGDGGVYGPEGAELRQPLYPCSFRARTPTTYVEPFATSMVMLVEVWSKEARLQLFLPSEL